MASDQLLPNSSRTTRHQRRGGYARLQKAKLISVGLFAPLAGHRYTTLTFRVFVVSLPRMSITFTTMVYSPASP
jgi:hypothetical protein